MKKGTLIRSECHIIKLDVIWQAEARGAPRTPFELVNKLVLYKGVANWGYDKKGRVEVQILNFKCQLNLYMLTLGCNAAKKPTLQRFYLIL